MFDIKAISLKRILRYYVDFTWIKRNKFGIFSFIFTFAIMLSFISITLSRNTAIQGIKQELNSTINKLNEIGIDIAYENIEFNSIFIYPLLSVQNLQIYNLQGKNLWNITFKELNAQSSLFGSNNIKFQFAPNAQIRINSKTHPISFENGKLRIKTDKKQQISFFETSFKNINIKDIAKIKRIRWNIENIDPNIQAPVMLPTLETNIEANDIALNGLLNYPLTSQIHRIFVRAHLIGKLSENDSFLLSAENWLQSGGFIEIPSFLVSWDPLLMVGRGAITFDEKFAPKAQLHTSSKAMQELLQDLLKIGFIDKKGAFVANILLSTKSFKLKKEDKHLTVSTPISYSDGKLAIENVTIKTIPQ